jgi:hypothetical protein
MIQLILMVVVIRIILAAFGMEFSGGYEVMINMLIIGGLIIFYPWGRR